MAKSATSPSSRCGCPDADVRWRGERHGPAFRLSDDEVNALDLCRQSLRCLRLPMAGSNRTLLRCMSPEVAQMRSAAMPALRSLSGVERPSRFAHTQV